MAKFKSLFPAVASVAFLFCSVPDASAQFYVWRGGEAVYALAQGLADSVTFTVPADTIALVAQKPDPSAVGGRIAKPSEGVDLGTGVLWAPWNVGASCPTELGALFAWGEVTPKAEHMDGYTNENYRWTYGQHSSDNPKKYNDTDGKRTLDAQDDAATANWGGGWRIPTQKEFEDLLNNCDWTYKLVGEWHGNSKPGWLVCGKTPKQKSVSSALRTTSAAEADSCYIFLPCYSGGVWADTYYWNAGVSEPVGFAQAFSWNGNILHEEVSEMLGRFWRSAGMPVRAVRSIPADNSVE